jgi:hypothetical protein
MLLDAYDKEVMDSAKQLQDKVEKPISSLAAHRSYRVGSRDSRQTSARKIEEMALTRPNLRGFLGHLKSFFCEWFLDVPLPENLGTLKVFLSQ